MSDNKKCIDIKHKSLQSGWGCCQCNTYNGDQRYACKYCRHPRCKEEPELLENNDYKYDKNKLN